MKHEIQLSPKTTKQRRIVAAIIALAGILVIIAIILIGYEFRWTGFNGGYSKVTITTDLGKSPPKEVTKMEEFPSAKTLWDWLQLLGVLAIPVAVGLGTLWFTKAQNENSNAIAENQRQEIVLQTYLDRMSELLLDKGKQSSSSNVGAASEQAAEIGENALPHPANPLLNLKPEALKIARARTLTALRQLDANRKGSLLQFLHDCDLLDSINLQEADLNKANLKAKSLPRAQLNLAHLEEADLSFANLSKIHLAGARLDKANLYMANLSDADLREAVITHEQILQARSIVGAKISNHLISPEIEKRLTAVVIPGIGSPQPDISLKLGGK